MEIPRIDEGRRHMTLMMFLLDYDHVVVAADTLATDPDGTTPFYDHKIRALGGGMCTVATGTANLLFEWLETHRPGTSLASIETRTPEALSEIARGLGKDIRATIYVFGRDGADEPYAGFVFRSVDGFKAERLRYGFHAKPPVHEVVGTAIPEGPPEWADLAERLKAHEDAKPVGDGVPIGGELDLAILMDGEVRTSTIHRFR
jgi:hypothetical protein